MEMICGAVTGRDPTWRFAKVVFAVVGGAEEAVGPAMLFTEVRLERVDSSQTNLDGVQICACAR